MPVYRERYIFKMYVCICAFFLSLKYRSSINISAAGCTQNAAILER